MWGKSVFLEDNHALFQEGGDQVSQKILWPTITPKRFDLNQPNLVC